MKSLGLQCTAHSSVWGRNVFISLKRGLAHYYSDFWQPNPELPAPVGGAGAKQILLHPVGYVAAAGASSGEGDINQFCIYGTKVC